MTRRACLDRDRSICRFGGFRCRIGLRDIPGEDSYYRLDVVALHRAFGRQTGREYVSERVLPLDASGDPVLGAGRVADGDAFRHLLYDGCLFTDDAFRDGEVSLTVRVDLDQMDQPFIWSSDDGNPVDYHGVSSLRIKVTSLPREDYELTEYRRFRWDDLYDNLGFLSYLEEEGVYPNNVENAIGNVFLRCSASRVTDILEMDYTSDDPGHPSVIWKVPSE